MMGSNILSISSSTNSVRQDIFPLDQWTITTRKGIILQSKCTCKLQQQLQQRKQQQDQVQLSEEQEEKKEKTSKEVDDDELCNICRYHKLLPNLHNMPDMLFNNNLLRLEHFTGYGIEFNALDALKLVEETQDPLRVAVADGWQSARSDFPFAKSIIKPFDWTFTTDYRGTILSGLKKAKMSQRCSTVIGREADTGGKHIISSSSGGVRGKDVGQQQQQTESAKQQQHINDDDDDLIGLEVQETSERIDVNKLKVREEILFYDDITLYEDELADHGTAQYSVKVRVMPKSLFILARFYLRVDGVLARINDTRIYHELGTKYLLREYTNREARLSSLQLPVATLINPNELTSQLPIIKSSYEKLIMPRIR